MKESFLDGEGQKLKRICVEALKDVDPNELETLAKKFYWRPNKEMIESREYFFGHMFTFCRFKINRH